MRSEWFTSRLVKLYSARLRLESLYDDQVEASLGLPGCVLRHSCADRDRSFWYRVTGDSGLS